jgi:hypothetical protein
VAGGGVEERGVQVATRWGGVLDGVGDRRRGRAVWGGWQWPGAEMCGRATHGHARQGRTMC